MTNESTTTSQLKPTLKTRMLIGATIGLAVICFFILPVGKGNPDWGRFWMIRPLIVVPFAGAMGGLVSYFMAQLAELNGWNKILISILTAIICIIGLWMGIVLGLNGTMWN